MPALGRGIRAHVVEVTAFSAIFVGMGVASQHRPVAGLILGRRQGCKATNTCFDINPFSWHHREGSNHTTDSVAYAARLVWIPTSLIFLIF